MGGVSVTRRIGLTACDVGHGVSCWSDQVCLCKTLLAHPNLGARHSRREGTRACVPPSPTKKMFEDTQSAY